MLNYISIMLGGALGTGARFWLSGIMSARYRRVPVRHAPRERLWLLPCRVGCHRIGSGRSLHRVPKCAAVLCRRRVRRLHHFFGVRTADARTRDSRRLAEGLHQCGLIPRALPACGLARARHCSCSAPAVKCRATDVAQLCYPHPLRSIAVSCRSRSNALIHLLSCILFVLCSSP